MSRSPDALDPDVPDDSDDSDESLDGADEILADPTQTLSLGDPFQLVVGLDCRSMNLYRFLRVRFPESGRAVLQRWLSDQHVLVNGTPVTDSRPLRHGDVIQIIAPDRMRKQARKAPDVEVLYSDASIIAVDKPSGIATAPERESSRPDLLSSLREQFATDGRTPRLVHRIDKHASGVVVFARGRDAKRALIEDFSQRVVTKDYLAVVTGSFPDDVQMEESRLAPRVGRQTTMTVGRRGKASITLFRRLAGFRGYSLVHARPLTGRTHQIRVHLQHLGYPIVGDDRYGGEPQLLLSRLKSDYRRGRGEQERPMIARLALHAAAIRLKSPADGVWRRIHSAPPKDLRSALRQLEKHRPLQAPALGSAPIWDTEFWVEGDRCFGALEEDGRARLLRPAPADHEPS